MIDAMYIAATGMTAEEMRVNVIANNLANVNTTGFKKSRISFEDLMYRTEAASLDGNITHGLGTAPVTSEKIFTVGDLKQTGEPLDVAIHGKGFFELQLPNGSYGYTRSGELEINDERTLVSANGYPLSAMVYIPTDTEEVVIESDGVVKVRAQNEKKFSEAGVIEISTFINPNGLMPQGENIYLPSVKSGDAIYETAGSNGVGKLAQGYLEGSNVEFVDELTSLMTAQRAYAINAKIVQATDDIMGIINSLRK